MASHTLLAIYKYIFDTEEFWYSLEDGEPRHSLDAQISDIGRYPFDKREPMEFELHTDDPYNADRHPIYIWVMGVDAVECPPDEFWSKPGNRELTSRHSWHTGNLWVIRGYLNGLKAPGGTYVEGVFDVRRRDAYVRAIE